MDCHTFVQNYVCTGMAGCCCCLASCTVTYYELFLYKQPCYVGLFINYQEEIESTVRTAKKTSAKYASAVKRFTEDLRELMKDILDNPKFLPSEMLKKYIDIMKCKREFSKHPPLSLERLVILSIYMLIMHLICCYCLSS